MIVVGLTGGIGSGKSTVSAGLVERGATLLDADAITRELQQPGQAVFAAIVERFGPASVAADGSLDRQAIADLVFSEAEAKADLEAIVHPAVSEEMARRMAELSESDALVVLDIPLLVEKGREGLAGIIVVDTSPAVALQRLIEQRGFTVEDAEARMANQASRADRIAKADFVVDNNGDREALVAELDRCWEWLRCLA